MRGLRKMKGYTCIRKTHIRSPLPYLYRKYFDFHINHEQRIDILETSKHIRVEIEGIEVANTVKARLLYETGLPTRAYIPMTDIRLDLVTPSQLTTSCPYKVSLLPPSPQPLCCTLPTSYDMYRLLGRCELL